MTSAHILVIDDELPIQRMLKIALEANDHEVQSATEGRRGIQLAAQHQPDLVILDLGLPDMSGHEVLRQLREWYQRPILILSVRDAEEDIVRALDNGANDYLCKPFRTGELLARIRTALRRNDAGEEKPLRQLGDLEIDLAARVVRKGGQEVHLTVTEYRLLSLMVQQVGRVLTHQYLLREVWGPGYQLETQYLRVYVGQLRKKIEDDPQSPRHLLTESGVGYRLV